MSTYERKNLLFRTVHNIILSTNDRLSHWVDFGSDIFGRFKIESCVHVDFYAFIIHF